MKLGKLSRKATAAAIGGALALTGVGVSAAALSSPDTQPVSDQTEVTEPTPTSSAQPTDVAEPTQPQPVVEQPAEQPAAGSVDTVTSSQKQEPAPRPIPADEDRSGIGTTGPDGNYTPAPPIQRSGEPPVLPPPPPPPVPKLPGEPGYQPPTG